MPGYDPCNACERAAAVRTIRTQWGPLRLCQRCAAAREAEPTPFEVAFTNRWKAKP